MQNNVRMILDPKDVLVAVLHTTRLDGRQVSLVSHDSMVLFCESHLPALKEVVAYFEAPIRTVEEQVKSYRESQHS